MGDLHLIRYMKPFQEVRENEMPEISSELSLLTVSGVWFEKRYKAKGYSNILQR